MTIERTLSPAQLEQRRAAPLRHGARAEAANVPAIERRWRLLRRGLNKRGVRVRDIDPRDWLRLRILVRYVTLMELLEPHLFELLAGDPARAGDDLVERYTGWLASANDVIAKLPADLMAAAAGDLAAGLRKQLPARPRRAS